MSTHVLQGTLVLTDRLVEHGQIVIEGGHIEEVIDDGPHFDPTDDYGENFILPGLIDLHVHGIGGTDVMDGTPDSLARMARLFAAHGVTGFLPTTVTHDLALTRRVITCIGEYANSTHQVGSGAQILGIHLEGPFINPQFKGMQNSDYILPPNEATARDLVAAGQGLVNRVSIAPEMPGADAIIRALRVDDIAVSIAHTGATYEQAINAVELGARHVTHCFNAMLGLHHRSPGTVGAALTCDELTAELIPDGIHVHPAVMRLLIRVKGRERVTLVTDSMSATDMADGEYDFGGHQVFVRDGVARLRDGTLASSTVTMDAAVRNVMNLCDVSLADAVYMASTSPAEALGLWQSKGQLLPGYDADLAVFDAGMRPVATWIAGEPYSNTL